MAASDELPRGWNQVASRIGAGSAVTITFPATPGISWVLTAAALTFAMTVGSSQDVTAWIDLSSGLTIPKLVYLEDWFANGVTGSMTGDWSGPIAGPAGGALTLTVNGSQAGNGNVQMTATAYPI